MRTTDIGNILALLFAELVDGAADNNAFVLNGGDAGLLRSLDRLSASDASQSAHGGATIAAHVRHVRYGLSLMNRWASEGGNPFANADWSEAWKTTAADDATWSQIRRELREEVRQWLPTLKEPRDAAEVELTGMIASVVHLAYHLGAIRQIDRNARGPKEGAGSERRISSPDIV
jgi:hypothetical protein